jgi:predicted metal-dependent hydrolase
MSKIKIRKFEFDLEKDMVHNYSIDHRLTRILNSLSLLFPVGERFFIESIRAYRNEVNPRLQKEIDLFIRQEGQHGREHRKLNKLLNVDEKKIDESVRQLLSRYATDKEHALMATVVLERYTGLMGLIVPKIGDLVLHECQISELWKMHAKEETEHVHVGELILKEKCNFGPITQARYMIEGAYHLIRETSKIYKIIERANA